jgi:hypothetical protein
MSDRRATRVTLRPSTGTSIKTKTFWEAEVRAKPFPGKSKAVSLALCSILLAVAPAAAQKKGGHAAALSQRQSAQRFPARGIDHRVGDAVFGRVQQPRGVRSLQGPREP